MHRTIVPSYTQVTSRARFLPSPDGSFIYRETDGEDRFLINDKWLTGQNARGINLVPLLAETSDSAVFGRGDSEFVISLFDGDSIREFLAGLPSPIYLEITALAYGTWAPLIRAAHDADVQMYVVYVEPSEYTKIDTVGGVSLFNLSDRTEGLAPLPGFARLATRRNEQESVFVALLGFEGDRFARVLEAVQPLTDHTYSIIGLPGFRLEYPFYALRANLRHIEGNTAGINLRYARANCPFAVYSVLHDLLVHYPARLMQIAVLGTKPHALGAVLFALLHPSETSLIYDHPIRSKQRTSGAGNVCIYDISRFLEFATRSLSGSFG